MFLDECGFALNLHRFYGWSLKSERCMEAVPFQRGQNRSVLGAFSLPVAGTETETEAGIPLCPICPTGMRGLWQKLGAIKRQDFEGFLRDDLLPVLEPGSVLVLDNARIHHGGQIAQIVEAAGCSLLYLPPYSPDFSPIELAWSWIKNQVRAAAPRNDDDRQKVIYDVAAALPAHAAPGWFRKCGLS